MGVYSREWSIVPGTELLRHILRCAASSELWWRATFDEPDAVSDKRIGERNTVRRRDRFLRRSNLSLRRNKIHFWTEPIFFLIEFGWSDIIRASLLRQNRHEWSVLLHAC